MNFPQPETITIRRSSVSETIYENGIPVDTAAYTETTGIKANLQPLTEKELQMLPEGDRVREAYKIYTKTELKKNDIIVRNLDGEVFELRKIAKWVDFTGRINHYKAIVLILDGE